MNNNLHCKWLGLPIYSPYIIASLTMTSKVSLEQHISYYKKVSEMGAGAIVLPSINPSTKGDHRRNTTIADCLKFNTGLNHNHIMGFTVLGPSEPNIISLDYGVALAQNTKKNISIPIIGSIANIGSEHNVLNAIDTLCQTGIDGLELNFSCPNVITKNTNQSVLTIELLEKIRRKCTIPISLKITPYQDYTSVIEAVNGEINGLTLSNAYIGLIPPNVSIDNFSPFNRRTEWAPSGVYGPFEKMLTYKQIYNYHKIASRKNFSIACVGGIVEPSEGIQALLLGADVVQLSSAILWKSISIFKEFNKELECFMSKNNFSNIEQVKGLALPYIKDCTDDLTKPATRTMKVDQNQCKKCNPCSCIDRLCIAISQYDDKTVTINQDMCSGCGMCFHLCRNSAIDEIRV